MASKSAQQEPEKAEVIEELLDQLDTNLDRVKVLYEQYFLGIQKQPPTYLHADLERKIRDLSQLQIRNTALRYRFATLTQKFGSYNTYWRRTLRQIENGTYIRQLSKVGRQAAKTGAEVPEEILAAMPKRMREQVKRDREAALAVASRRHQSDELLTLAEEEMNDDDVAAFIKESTDLRRNMLTETGAIKIDAADAEADFDFDAFFASVIDESAPEPSLPSAPPMSGGAPMREENDEPTQPVMVPVRAPNRATPAPNRTTPAPNRATPAPNRASQPVVSPVATNRATPDAPVAAPNRASQPVASPVAPNRATPDAPVAASNRATPDAPPVAAPNRASQPAGADAPGTPRVVPPRPNVPPNRASQPIVPPVIPPVVRGVTPAAGTPRVTPTSAPPPQHQTQAIPRVPLPSTSPMRPIPPPPKIPLAPSQLTRPIPVIPGSLNTAQPVPVETMAGPFAPVPSESPPAPPPPKPSPAPAAAPVAKPAPKPHRTPRPLNARTPPPEPQSPPPGMTDADVNALYATYVKAKEMVGEPAGPGAYGKLLKTINAQAPKIMEQYKSKGVDFSIVVKDNQVIIRAKPK